LFCLAALLAVLAGSPALGPPCHAQEMQSAYLRLNASTYEEFTAAVKTAEMHGAILRHRFYPYAAMGLVPEGAGPEIASIGPVTQFFVNKIPESQFYGMSKEEANVARAYNSIYFSPAAPKEAAESMPGFKEVGGEVEPGTGSAASESSVGEGEMVIDFAPKTVPAEDLAEIKAAARKVGLAAPPAPATSEFMLGHIAVGVIMPESKPGFGRQDWTDAEEERAVEEAISAMDWWAKRSPNQELRFSYEINYRVPISLEPLDIGGMQTEGQWASESLENLGYSGTNRFAQAYLYIDDMRMRYGTDWGFVMFILHGTPGQAFGQALAYAYLGGPFNVNAYSNGDLGPEDLDRVIAHETGHIFYTLDEYASAPVTCMVRSGYLYVENANKQDGEPGCKSDVPCVMRGSSQQVPLFILQPCYYTEGQVGWRDTDGDGIPDILDTDPVLEFVNVDTAGVGAIVSGDTLYSTTVSFEGKAKSVPIQNLNPRSGLGGKRFTVEQVGAEYRVDGGAWTSCEPADGWFDSSSERFDFTVAGLDPWTSHAVEVRAVTAHGNSTPDDAISSFQWFVVPASGKTSFLRVSSSNPTRPPVSIDFYPVHPSGRAGLFVQVRIEVYDMMGRKIDTIENGRFETGRYHTATWDGDDLDGKQVRPGVYLVSMTSQGRRQAAKVLVIP
jgi:hypothetical protein